MTPGRVAQAMGSILAVIGTPTRSPKPRGKSPGWKTGRSQRPLRGRTRKRRIKYPIVKKTTPKPPKKTKESA